MPTAPDPHVIVVFGARGDLAKRKLLPGLYRLLAAGMLPEQFAIIGSGRHAPDSDDAFCDDVRAALDEFVDDDVDEGTWSTLRDRLRFVASSADDGSELARAVEEAEGDLGDDPRRLLFLSVPPSATSAMVRMLGDSGLAERARVVMEKPFGSDLASARELNEIVHDVLDEEHVFRIDHFLGKEATQNILAFRFANGLFEPAWNRDHIAYVQIDVPEDMGLEGRASFYEETGAFRDMVVTHLMQLLGFVAMEPPVRLDARSLRNEKAKVFEATEPFDPGQTVYGQFAGYRDEDDVDDESRVETLVAMCVHVDTWRWAGVPFVLRTGKAMKADTQTITVGFREPPLRMFDPSDDVLDHPNEVCFDLTGDGAVTVDLRAKRPGPVLELGSASLGVAHGAGRDGDRLEAYERLLLDAMHGDHTLFTRADEIERLWELAQPLLDAPPRTQRYAEGSWGPDDAAELAGPAGWRVSRGG
ncbi:MAG: glucose-6-phosphate dehydrogenase [Actinomycetota bacterium]|nr:glucose-6-phosphate dehydrogenase [Actinomycetota bacterium]